MISLARYIMRRNVRAFLWALRYGEGTQGKEGYRTLFGGQLFKGPDGVYATFDDFSDHPRMRVTMRLKKGGTLTSTAAGAYQFLERTWDGLVKQYGFKDFEPPTQDLAAIALIAGRKALEDVVMGRIELAVQKCNKEWASLPGSPYGQPVVTMQEFLREYEEAGGLYQDEDAIDVQATVVPETPAPKLPPVEDHIPVEVVRNSPASVTLQEKPMALTAIAAALAPTLIPSLIKLVPQLTKLFGTGSEVSNRNMAAVEAVFEVAKDAIGAKNEQELVETIETNPEQAQQVRQAIETNWFKIEEVGGGIEAARAANLQLSVRDKITTTAPDGSVIVKDTMVPYYMQPAFVVTCLLMLPIYFVVFIVLQPWWGEVNYFSDEVKLVVVTAVISGLLSSIGGFWLGSSFGSQKKDEANANRVRSTDL